MLNISNYQNNYSNKTNCYNVARKPANQSFKGSINRNFEEVVVSEIAHPKVFKKFLDYLESLSKGISQWTDDSHVFGVKPHINGKTVSMSSKGSKFAKDIPEKAIPITEDLKQLEDFVYPVVSEITTNKSLVKQLNELSSKGNYNIKINADKFVEKIGELNQHMVPYIQESINYFRVTTLPESLKGSNFLISAEYDIAKARRPIPGSEKEFRPVITIKSHDADKVYGMQSFTFWDGMGVIDMKKCVQEEIENMQTREEIQKIIKASQEKQ